MSPKDKTKELLEKYYTILVNVDMDYLDIEKAKLVCRKSVILLCDEILNSVKFYSNLQPLYWKEVKQEIEKL